ncbi:hypothetical protein ACSMX9_04470 [Streptomyces sp. LE64]|uniref:hypothetical protein n=1 Tax=Streptomyces sp. LE64 TaxID=3448653 RepID=UPI00404380CC
MPARVAEPVEAHGPTGRAERGERGATRIADRVIAKIAARAALEALATDPGPPGAAPGAPPHATVAVHQDSARIRVVLELGYPCDIGARCAAVRHRVTERVQGLAGMEVPEVTVLVERLHSPRAHDTRGNLR